MGTQGSVGLSRHRRDIVESIRERSGIATGTSFSSAERYRASGLNAPGAADDTVAHVRPIERDGQRDAGARVAPSISTV
jgi:hypothetical protein